LAGHGVEKGIPVILQSESGKGSEGLGRVARKLASRLLKTNESIWFVKDLREEEAEVEIQPTYEVIMDGFDEISEWLKSNVREYPWIYSAKEIGVAREYGHLIPFMKDGGKIIGYTKVALNKVYIRDYDRLFNLGPGKAMFYDTTFLPEYRGKRLPQQLKKAIFELLRKKGVRWVFAHIEPWNIPSIRSNERAGFKKVGTNTYVKFLCFRVHSNNPRKLLS
jgi:RimJ/RimL family protein N-acetyltransferase